MKTILSIVIFIVAVWGVFRIISIYKKAERDKEFAKKFPIFKKLVLSGSYEKALKMLKSEEVFRIRHKLEPEQREKIAILEIKCLEELDRLPEAVTALAAHLSAVYRAGEWPEKFLSKWIELYKSCGPIDVEKFYFCPHCGLHPETIALLQYAIKKENCPPPINYPGKGGPAVMIEWGSKKYQKKN